ncbi:hypothetical protein [Streptomyces sp. NPDC018610]|uniref:hypothetical protein n=1 Tax=Streptomyces sp. NPDC018610 TaxID=3365049 RepID=UPI0037969E9F
MTRSRASARGTAAAALAVALALALSSCGAADRATSPSQARKLAGSAEAVRARQATESRLRDVARAYADRTSLALGLLVVRDACLAGKAKQWIEPNGEDAYQVRCALKVTAYYGADPDRIVPVLDGVLSAGDRTGSVVPFTHGVQGAFVAYYRDRGSRDPEITQMSVPDHTLSWDPVRDRRSGLMIKEPERCPADDPPMDRCAREPGTKTVAALRERYGMVFALELTSPQYYEVSKDGRVSADR